MAAKKVCRVCGERKSQSEFYSAKTLCKNCHNKRAAECAAIRRQQQGKKSGNGKGWTLGRRRSELHSGQCTKCHQIFPLTPKFFNVVRRRGREEFRQACKQCLGVQVKCYQQGSAYKSYAKEKRQRPGQREYHREASRKFHAKPEYREYDRALYAKMVTTSEGREKFRIKVRRRRARVNGSTRNHTVEDIRIALEVQRRLCFYCETDVSTKYTVDHLIPLVRGGSDGPENIVIACANCNFRKADKTPEEFALGITHKRKAFRLSSPAGEDKS